MPSTQSIAVMQGSAQLHSLEVGGFRITDARFPPALTLPSHYHPRACFAVVLAGSVDKRFPGKAYPSSHSTIVTMPPQERHWDQFEHKGAHMLVVEPTQVSDELLAPCIDIFNQINHFRSAELAHIAWRISQEVQTPDEVSPLSVNGMVLELLSLAIRKSSRRQSTQQFKQPPPWLKRAKELIHECFRENLTVELLATAVNVHPVHLARTYRACYGVTLGTAVRQLRLEWATKQITQSHDSLATIAAQAGFADQSHLTRVFRQHKGTTPGQFRQQLKTKGAKDSH